MSVSVMYVGLLPQKESYLYNVFAVLAFFSYVTKQILISNTYQDLAYKTNFSVSAANHSNCIILEVHQLCITETNWLWHTVLLGRNGLSYGLRKLSYCTD